MAENTKSKKGASHTEVNMTVPNNYKNGDNIHFDYSQSSDHLPSNPQVSNSTLNKKKKNKKKKNKNKSNTNVATATINNPDDDYPTSRVIRQGPDGSVIVESLDKDDINDDIIDNDNSDLSEDFQHRLGNPVVDIWFHNSTPEEREDLKNFWASLDIKQRVKLASVSKDELLSLVRLDPRQATKGTSKEKQDLHAYASQNCTCNHCGKKRNLVVSEIERLYDQNIDAINDFIKGIRDLNQLPNLPSILFEGYKDTGIGSHGQSMSHNDDHYSHHSHNNLHNHHIQSTSQSGPQNINDALTSNSNKISEHTSILPPGVNEEMINQFGENFQHMIKALNVEAFNKLPKDKQNLALNEINFVKQFLNENSKGTEAYQEISKNFKFIQQMDKLMELNGKSSDVEIPLKKEVNKLMEDIFQNDGKGFIEMMDSLSYSRNTREFIKDNSATIDPVKDFHRQIRQDALEFKRNSQKPNGNHTMDQAQYHEDVINNVNHEVTSIEDLEDEYGSVYDESEGFDEEVDLDAEYEDEDELDDEDEYENDYNDESSNVDFEISEEEKLHELRHIFLMQVVRLFRQRLRNAYKDKLSQDRTQKLIEELEAEENAKKEKELKKLKQKEKAKEKKRLQLLAREEEKKRKEEELKAKAEEKKRKEEQLKQEQRRRKEEMQRKKEEEKIRRIEGQQKKLALQREKEEKARLAKLEDEKQKQKLEALQDLKLEEHQTNQVSSDENKITPTKQELNFNDKAVDHTIGSKGQIEENSKNLDSAGSLTSTIDQVANNINNNIEKPNVAHNIGSNPLLQELYSVKSTPKLENRWFQTAASTSPTPKSAQSQTQPFASTLSNLANPIGSSFQDPFVDSFNTPHPSVPPGLNNISIKPPISTLPPPGLTKSISNTQIPVASGLQNNGMNSANVSGANLSNLGSISGIGSNVWNNPTTSNGNTRNNSIWNNTNTNNGSIWNGGSNSSTPNNKLLNISVGNANNSDSIGILNAAYLAFKILNNTNSEYGVVQSFTLFQATQSMMPSNNLNFNQFLNSLSFKSDLLPFRFELVYDDYGTVNFIKLIENSNSPLTVQQSLNGMPQLSQPNNDINQPFNPLSSGLGGSSTANGGINLNQPIMSLGANSYNSGKNLWN